MSPEQWNGFFIGGGAVLLLILLGVAIVALVIGVAAWKHVRQLWYRLSGLSVNQDEDGQHILKLEARKRFVRGDHVSIDPVNLDRITSLFPDLEAARDERSRGDGDPKAGGSERP